MNVPSNVADAINSSEIGATIADGTLSVGLWGWLKLDRLNGNAYFTVMIMGAISVIIFCKLMLANITIKMPDSVPPAVSKSICSHFTSDDNFIRHCYYQLYRRSCS